MSARAGAWRVHLAGHTARRIGQQEILIDTHNMPVCDAVWKLYAAAAERFSDVPALIEWDADIPALDVLVAEAYKADAIAGVAHVAAA
jgi:uncharacterized protein (UPF0276 family)